MKLLVLLGALITAPVNAEPSQSLNILATVGQCEPEYLVSIKLYPADKQVKYSLYIYKDLTEMERAGLSLEAQIPLMMVSYNNCV